MFEGRRFENEDTSVDDYEYTDRDTGEVYTTPFPVVVFTIENELLGVGLVVGEIEWGEDCMPVIEVDDADAPSGKVHLLGAECWWAPAAADVTDILSSKGMDQLVGAFAYSQKLDQEDQASQN
jgi:hypothetical protein